MAPLKKMTSEAKNSNISTPHVHKFKTEMCKNWEAGYCPYGDEKCSFAHGKAQLMQKSNLPSNYKTKQCENFKKGTCKYGSRCQFLHGDNDSKKMVKSVEQEEAKKVLTSYSETL